MSVLCSAASLDGALVFSLRPEERAFWWTGHNDFFIRVRNDGIYLGTDECVSHTYKYTQYTYTHMHIMYI